MQPLADPPRPVPLALRVKILFGGVLGQVGWLFLLVGSILCWVFVPSIDWSFGGYESTATGVVDRVEQTSSTENDRVIHEVHYRFEGPDGTPVSGVSYTTDVAGTGTGTGVSVEFDPDDPSRSRIAGMRSKPFPMWTAFVLLFPLIGAAFAAYAMRQGARAAALLRDGRLARGRLIGKEATRTEVNDRPVLAMTFAFETDDGQSHKVVARTHLPELLEDEATEKLLYLPADPSRATLLGHLPGRPDIGERGQLVSRNPLSWPLYLLVPAGWLLATIGFLALMS
jgi:Protein of unknown function (DUF3592)